ncbi:hypothetical protein [Motiliproteus sp. SC1-56]|uniref:hypothetical protein n=1 Tax=Motiliproteus sp. SC1-56 TaxID=2799565 RepID=UPI001A8D8A02|nr:hypothetical protein [Motiliproteus sp. SC1-56]
MLDWIQWLARRLSPWRPAFWLLTALALGASFYLLFAADGAAQDRWLLLSSMLFAWGLSLEAMVLCFAEVPPRPSPELGFLARLAVRVKRWLAALVALLFLGLMGAVAWVSLRALLMALDS